MIHVFLSENGGHNVIFDLLQRFLEIDFAGGVLVVLGVPGILIHDRKDLLAGYVGVVCQQKRLQKRFPELLVVSGPGIGLQYLAGIRCEADDVVPAFQTEFVQIEVGQLPNVIGVLPQGGQLQCEEGAEQGRIPFIQGLNVGSFGYVAGEDDLQPASKIFRREEGKQFGQVFLWDMGDVLDMDGGIYP